MSTITYIVKVVSAQFTIDDAVAPKLTFRDGDTYVFDQADSSNSGHILQFSITSNNSGGAEYTTGVTKTGTAGSASSDTTIITSGSTTDTLYYYSSGGGTYGSEFSNTGFTTTSEGILKPIVGAEATAEKWGPMVNHAIDQIVDKTVPKSGGTFTGAVIVDANLTVSGTTTTINTALTVSDAMVVNNAGSDVGVKVNSTSSGHILQLQDSGVDKVVVADGGATTFSAGLVANTVDINGGTIDGVTSFNGTEIVTSATNNLGIGVDVLNTIGTGDYNVAFGDRALYDLDTGITNTAIGYNSAQNTTEGDENTVVGSQALNTNISGDANVAVGSLSLHLCSTGGFNTALGTSALYNTTGSNNTAIGKSAGDNITSGSSNIMIGADVDAPSATGSNQLNIGNTIYGDTSTGNVGIGTDAPATNLHIADASAAILRLHHDSNSGTPAIQLMRGTNDTFGADAYTDWQIKNSGGNCYFQNELNAGGLNNRMTILSSGNVGIGTDAPAELLEIAGTAGASAGILISDPSAPTYGAILKFDDANNNIYVGSRSNGTDLNQITIKRDSGSVGIGADPGTSKLYVFGSEVDPDVSGGSMTGGINIRGDGTTVGSGAVIRFGSAGGGKESFGTIAAIHDSTNNGAMTFHVYNGGANHPECMRISSSGMVRCLGSFQTQGGYDTTMAASANVAIQTDGTLRRTTSSRKYKQNITPYEKGLAEILKLEAVSFNSKTDDTERFYAGLIAEDVNDQGLKEFIEYNNDNEPESIFYPHMVSLFVNAVKELSAKVTALENA